MTYRFANETDCGLILTFIRQLAEYEKMFGIEGGIVINGDRITVARNLEYDMLYTDFCTFQLRDGKMIVHDLEVQDFMPIGDFEADFKLEDNKLTLTEGTTTIVFEKYDEQ